MNSIPAYMLRAGNYHSSADFSHPRLGISSVLIDGKAYAEITTYGVHSVGLGDMIFEPIPLSPAWLIAFGFEPTHNSEYYISYWLRPSNVGVSHCIKQNEYSDVDTFNIINNDIKYVHELQNIYLDLYGKQLKTR